MDSGFTFDDEGRLTTQTGTGSKTLTWDPKSRVASVNTGSTTESYAYDPMDHRIQRSGGALGNLSYYLEGDHLESVYSGGALQEKYFRGSTIDELVAGYVYQSGALTPFMFQHDQVMSVTATTKPNGGTQASQTFWAFGETQSTTGTAVTRLGFTGRENDGTGLMQYRARYYDPAIGRFVSEDPKKQAAGINFYAYVGNDPTDANDPMGLQEMTSIGDVKRALVGLGLLFGGEVPLIGKYLGSATVTAGTVGALTAAGGTAVTGGSKTDVAISGVTGFASGVASLRAPGVGTFGQGAANGAATDTVTQLWSIAVDPNKTVSKDFNYLEVLTAAIGGGAGNKLTQMPKSWTAPPTVADEIAGGTIAAGPAVMGVTFGQKLGGSSEGTSGGNSSGAGFGPIPSANPNASFSDMTGAGFGGGAAGGFLIYPNKPNNNSMQQVYQK